MSKDTQPTSVIDNTAAKRYELDTDGAIAFISYTKAPGIVSFDHTEVPTQLAGKGVGSRLAQGALGLARASGVKVVPRCSFIADYVKRHPQYQDLMVPA